MNESQIPYTEPSASASGFSLAEFAENPEPRCPCLLLLDTSGSMRGKPIAELNAGLQSLQQDLQTDPLAQKRAEIAIITFGPVHLEMDFTPASAFVAPTLRADGDTPMGAAILEGLHILEERKTIYRTNGITFFRPWIFLVTDGGPTDEYRQAADAVHDGESSRKFSFYAVGVKGADMNRLREIAPPSRPPVVLAGLSFREMFLWLSSSLKQVSRSTPGTAIQLSAPGWITTET